MPTILCNDATLISARVKSMEPAQKTITFQVNEQMLHNLRMGASAQVTIHKKHATREARRARAGDSLQLSCLLPSMSTHIIKVLLKMYMPLASIPP